MARLVSHPLGKLKGKAGDIVGRDFGYEHFISVRPEKYNVKKKLKKVGSKQRFYTAVKLAKIIVSCPDLKKVWNECKMPGKRGYNRIISVNSKLLKDNLPTTENIITPKGVDLILDTLEVTGKDLRCSYNMAGLIRPRMVITFIIVFYNPKKKEFNLNEIIGDQVFVQPEYADRFLDSKGENYVAKFNFERLSKYGREKFRNAILYTAVVGTAAVKNKKWWTSTVAIDISKFKLKLQYLPSGKKAKGDEGKKKISILRNTNSKIYKKQRC